MSSQPAGYSSSQAADNNRAAPAHADTSNGNIASKPRLAALDSQLAQNNDPSSSFSQATSASTNDSDRVFTPSRPHAETVGRNGNNGSGQGSSQESLLLQGLSQAAATLEKMPEQNAAKKRTADGIVKHARHNNGAPPAYVGSHSRNTSTMSSASTASSRMGDMSTELKSRLSYAMLKVQNGWQSHTIDELESLTSQAGSPTSSNSTLHGRHGSSASPKIISSHRPTPLSANAPAFSTRATDGSWQGSPTSPAHISSTRNTPALAPAVTIQPSTSSMHVRRESTSMHAHGLLSAHSQHASPRTPLHASPDHRAARTPIVDPVLFSPQSAIHRDDAESLNAAESLLYMSSPGNPAARNHHFPSSSQPIPAFRNGASNMVPSPQRTALPSSQPRKSLPSGRPMHSSQPTPFAHSPKKRVGFQKHTSDMGNGGQGRQANWADTGPPRHRLSLSSGMSGSMKPRPRLSAEDIDRMVDERAAALTSDSEDEIIIPVPTKRQGRG